jgi:uncharacterized protein YicC (UPF0701 family)
MTTSSPVQAALDALTQLKIDLKTRIGKEGGNLNRLMLTRLDVIQSTLMQIEPLTNMIKLVNQQTEVMVMNVRQISLLTAPDPNGENDEPAETKGQ